MNAVIPDEATLAALRRTTGVARITDPDGTVIGFFAPATDEEAASYLLALTHYDPKELERRKADTRPTRTTAEVLEHLITLTEDEPTRDYLRNTIQEVRERNRCDTP